MPAKTTAPTVSTGRAVPTDGKPSIRKRVAAFFASCFRRGLAQSLFLSSGIIRNPDYSMERIVEVLRLVRLKRRIPCYIHTKVLPGSSLDLTAQAVALSNRVSINLEAPEASRLAVIAPEKDFEKDLMGKIRAVSELCGARRYGRCDQTTQFVVGAAGETDQGNSRTHFPPLQPVQSLPRLFQRISEPGKRRVG